MPIEIISARRAGRWLSTVAVCLIAALTALQNAIAIPGRVMGLVWGTTIGLALAHLFAFRIAGRLVHDGRISKSDRIVSGIQLAAAAAVAVLVSVPVLIAPPDSELDWARYHVRRNHWGRRLWGRPWCRAEPNPFPRVRYRSTRCCPRRCRDQARAGWSLGVGIRGQRRGRDARRLYSQPDERIADMAVPKILVRAGRALSNGLYRATGGRLMGTVRGMPVLLLTVRGRKSGAKHTIPVLYLEDDGNVSGDRFRRRVGEGASVVPESAPR